MTDQTATDRAALRDRITEALAVADGWQFADGSDLYDLPDRERARYREGADAVLAVLPAPTDRAASPGAFVLWLDASDGSVPTHDGIQWPDGTVTIHHRHYGITTTHHSAEAACQAAHGKQGRIVRPEPAPIDRAAVLRVAADAVAALDPAEAALAGQHAWTDAAALLRHMADEAQPAPARPAEPEETDEQRADREETERDHAAGNHQYCGVTCEAEFPSDMLRNTILYRAIPGSKTMLAELERRAAAEAAPDAGLPARLEAALTERYTELGNPHSRMRRQEQGPDGWPAEHPVGPHHVAEVLRELLADEAQPPEAERHRPVALATPCANLPADCTHPYNWHASRGDCQAADCPCRTFVPGERPEPVDPRRILGVDPEFTAGAQQDGARS